MKEIEAGRSILRACGCSEENFINIVSCPTCGRTQIDLIHICEELEEKLNEIHVNKKMTVAVMGCVVNGPGEAREADSGIAGGDGWGMIFEKGVQVEKLPYDQLLNALLRRIEAL